MCRLVADSARHKSSGNKIFLFDMLMTRALADQGQFGGAGITDGVHVTKSGEQYSFGTHDEWYGKRFDNARAWMGHVRKPSAGTAAPSAESAHPFHFPKTGLIGSHNGFVTGVIPEKPESGIPYVDSYYTFAKLSELLESSGKVTKEVLNEWIESMGPGSEYAFMFYYKDELWVLKGIRPMFYITLNGGRVYCTSLDTIIAVASYTQALWGKEHFDWGAKVMAMPEHTAINITTNTQIMVRAPKTATRKVFSRLVNGVWE